MHSTLDISSNYITTILVTLFPCVFDNFAASQNCSLPGMFHQCSTVFFRLIWSQIQKSSSRTQVREYTVQAKETKTTIVGSFPAAAVSLIQPKYFW